MSGRGPSPRSLCAALVCALLAGCNATLPDGSPDPDPWEGFNRRIFWFNEQADEYVIEPIARGWDWVAPDPIQNSVQNFFQNLLAPVSVVGNLLQGKLGAAGTETARFALNSTLGFAGLFDPAAEWGIEPRREDLGQTLGTWGVPTGPYLVLPLIGPSNPRDAIGLAGDAFLYIDFYDATVEEIGDNAFALEAVDIENWRAINLTQIDNARERAFDWYVFVRNAYLQNRQAKVEDKDVPGLYDEQPAQEPEEDIYDLDDEDDLYDLEDDLYDLEDDE